MASSVISRLPRLSLPVKLAVFGASISMVLIGALALMLKRKRKKPRPYMDIVDMNEVVDETDYKSGSHNNNINHLIPARLKRVPPKSPTHSKSPNGDISSSHRGWSPLLQRLSRSGSAQSLHSDANSSSTLTLVQVQDNESYTPHELCDMGLELIQKAIQHWEEAIEQLDDIEGEMGAELEVLQDELHNLIGRAYHMRDHHEQQLFQQVTATAALDAAIQQMDMEYEEQKRRNAISITDSSDLDSFVSAVEIADLSDLDLQRESHHHLALYEAALLEVEHGTVPCRVLRTKDVLCSSDAEFLAKLYCIRLAFDDMFSNKDVRLWFMDMGRKMITDLLVKADRDPEEFQTAYDELLQFVKEPSSWAMMEDELKGRGVKMLSFYDIVIDFLLFDAFDDLDNPPSSVRTVIQNRWLSDGFKETALATAVWSVLKAKKRMLQYKKGFIAHFYNISEHVTPVLAWGFLGPNGNLKDLCFYFKDQVMAFMRDVFSFDKCRYTVVEQLSEDILKSARIYAEETAVQLTS